MMGTTTILPRRCHSDSFVKRLNQLTERAITESLVEIDREFESWLGAHQPASEGSAWLLEWAAEPMWLAARQAPIRSWRTDVSITQRLEATKDANLAIRFAREIDAINMARLLGVTGFYVPREHEFVPTQNTSEPSMTKDLGAGASATPSGSREPSPSGLGPAGFDPSHVFLPDVVMVLDELGDGEYCRTASTVSADTGVPVKRVMEVHRALRVLGFADFGPLCDTDSEQYSPRGSGYWITGKGEHLRDALASAIEAQRAGTPQSGPVHESAVAESQTPNPSLRTITSQGGTR
jgi:hypothetical protein